MINILSRTKVFGGEHIRFSHESQVNNCTMTAAVFLPPQIRESQAPLLIWLSGLTCNDENFMTKAGAFRAAAELGLAIVAPDTSPRGEHVPDDPEGAYDFGLGAGFYLNATQAPWDENYQMYDYIVSELPDVLDEHFPVDTDNMSISGHSMGGHGALTIALKNPSRFQSVSAFAPICAPMDCAWGEKAFSNYLGDNEEDWAKYDTCALIEAGAPELPTLIDQGLADSFLEEQLLLDELEAVCEDTGYNAIIRKHPGYDHSYFFISTFIEDHIRFHWDHLRQA
ncbi:S-formylglutathione hydrolase [Aequoribacter fuscus]|jgi:S-formylglutathione hydrolase|uniref:S-formylglutathione hydrolase n=1 Tax=Aequoribacter fuscus TaxID=2518989 RepID=F3L3E3_9GAMM|nr:S-formylglutathione hydrolase [Aequoribacter fuscus]EGG29135.1 S-formylglutathione hydrolase [Aequoribacter fuscus]QHJ86852.1 S-formylglutathione hydrolase [Aequoribacter fuscus]